MEQTLLCHQSYEVSTNRRSIVALVKSSNSCSSFNTGSFLGITLAAKQKRFRGRSECNDAPDLLLLTCTGVLRGYEGARRSHKVLMESLQMRVLNASINRRSRICFLEWRAISSSVEVGKGVDSFVIGDGKICFQNIHYKVDPVSRSEANNNGPT